MKYRIDPEYNHAIIDWGENCENPLQKDQYIVESDFVVPADRFYYEFRYDADTSNIVDQDQSWIDSLATGYRVYDFMKNPERANRAPIDQSYDILGLYKKHTFESGELKTVIYYSNYDFDTGEYSDPVVREDRTYYRKDDYYHKRQIVSGWYRRNGTLADTKTTLKAYTPEQAIAAGVRRRTNIVDLLKIQIAFLIAQTDSVDLLTAETTGKGLLRQYRDEIWDYKQGDVQVLTQAINTDTDHSWLNNQFSTEQGLITIRQYILSTL